MKYQLTKDGERIVSEFIEECHKRHKKISEYYVNDIDNVELPTRETILDEINSEKNFLTDLWYVGDKYYMRDWRLSKKHNIYASLELKCGTDFIEEKEKNYEVSINKKR